MTARGFTLIEILIAMAIFTMIGLASTALLTTVIDSDEASTEKFAELQQLQRFMLTLERDVLQVVDRPVRVEGEENKTVFRGGELDDSDADGMAFVRGGWHNPKLMLPRSTLQGVAYRLKNGNIERLNTVYVDNVLGYEPKVRVVLSDVTDFQLEFNTGEKDGRNDGWHDSFTGERLPDGIRVTVTTKKGGEFIRTFAIGGVTSTG